MKRTMQVTWTMDIELQDHETEEDAATIAFYQFMEGVPDGVDVRNEAGLVKRYSAARLTGRKLP